MGHARGLEAALWRAAGVSQSVQDNPRGTAIEVIDCVELANEIVRLREKAKKVSEQILTLAASFEREGRDVIARKLFDAAAALHECE